MLNWLLGQTANGATRLQVLIISGMALFFIAGAVMVFVQALTACKEEVEDDG